MLVHACNSIGMTASGSRRPKLYGVEQGRPRKRPRPARRRVVLVLAAAAVLAVAGASVIAARILPLTAGPAAVAAAPVATLPDGMAADLWARGSPTPPPQGIRAPAAAVVDVASGQVLWSRNAHVHRPVGRLAIMATVLAAVRSPAEIHQQLTVTGDMLGAQGTAIGLVAGQRVTVEDLLAGSLLVGGGDAADALAVWRSGSVGGFVPAMNSLARADGLRDSRFADPSGQYTRGTWSSAWDVAALARRVLARGYLAKLVAEQSYGNAVNANSLVFTRPAVLGVMAAPGREGGVAVATRRGGVTLLAVVLGGNHQARQALALLAWARLHDPVG